MADYNSDTFSSLHCSMSPGAATQLLQYVESIGSFNEENLTDIILKLARCPSSRAEQIIKVAVSRYHSEKRTLLSVLMNVGLRYAQEHV